MPSLAVPIFGDLMRYSVLPFVARLKAPAAYRKMFAPAPVSPSFADLFPIELAVRPWQLRATAEEAALLVPAAAALAGRYALLSQPIAIIAGMGDEVVDIEHHARRLSREIATSTLHEIPDAGHMVHHTEPEKVGAVIRGMADSPNPA
jgi:pimeloyl-ACP methyl ester carboxylesterase